MSIWKKFLEKKSVEAKRRGFNYMTSVFDSKMGQRRGGDDGFYKMIPILIGVIMIGGIIIIIFKGLLEIYSLFIWLTTCINHNFKKAIKSYR